MSSLCIGLLIWQHQFHHLRCAFLSECTGRMPQPCFYCVEIEYLQSLTLSKPLCFIFDRAVCGIHKRDFSDMNLNHILGFTLFRPVDYRSANWQLYKKTPRFVQFVVVESTFHVPFSSPCLWLILSHVESHFKNTLPINHPRRSVLEHKHPQCRSIQLCCESSVKHSMPVRIAFVSVNWKGQYIPKCSEQILTKCVL